MLAVKPQAVVFLCFFPQAFICVPSCKHVPKLVEACQKKELKLHGCDLTCDAIAPPFVMKPVSIETTRADYRPSRPFKERQKILFYLIISRHLNTVYSNVSVIAWVL